MMNCPQSPSPSRGEGVKRMSSPLMGEDKGEGDESCRSG